MAIGTYWYAGGPAAVETLLARRVACAVEQAEGQNMTGADAYLQVFDADSVPAAGSVPLYSYLVPTLTLLAKSFPGPSGIGRRMSSGVVVVWSTSASSYTPVGSTVGPLYVNGRDLAPGGS